MKRYIFKLVLVVWVLLNVTCSYAVENDYTLSPGDIIKIVIFQNPDLTTETRLSESGKISFPLLGEVTLKGLTVNQAENKITTLLKSGEFLVQPQVTVNITQFRGRQVMVLGQVNRPGRIPIEGSVSKVSQMLALAGGVTPVGADSAIVTRYNQGTPTKTEVDLLVLLQSGDSTSDFELDNNDVIYVPRAPVFYIYGEVQRPGSFRLERNMTVMQALSVGGGLTMRGTERGVRINRRQEDGQVQTMKVSLNDVVQPDDVIYIKESFF